MDRGTQDESEQLVLSINIYMDPIGSTYFVVHISTCIDICVCTSCGISNVRERVSANFNVRDDRRRYERYFGRILLIRCIWRAL